MKTKFFLSILLVFVTLGIPACAEIARDNSYLKKCNPELIHFLHNYNKKGTAQLSKGFSKKIKSGNLIHTTIVCADASATSQELNNKGIKVRSSLGNILTAYIPADQLTEWASKESVLSLIALDERSANLMSARSLSDVNKVHTGTDLQTPYTGKGVIVSLLDEGIQYDHVAFRESEDSTRVFATINFNDDDPQPVWGSKNIITLGEDHMDEYHGTHVMGIMAGGKTMGSSTNYGMAPDALIVAGSRKNFSLSEIIETLLLSSQASDSLGMPFVFNMSFGGTIHPHDGTGFESQILNSLVDNGCILVAAAGNEGNKNLHFSHQFANANETRYISFSGLSPYNASYLIANDSSQFSVRLYMRYNNSTQLVPIPESWLEKTGSGNESFLDENNGKYSVFTYIDTTGYQLPEWTDIVLGITSSQKGQTISGWTYKGEFSQYDANNPAPDSWNSIDEPAITEKVICVGSYTSNDKWTAISNKTFGTSSTVIGSLSYFSSKGPTENPNLLKPDVCAPGQWISSAAKRNCSELKNENKANATFTVERINYNGQYHVYAAAQGTSMATPATVGIIALWLQAKPDLTQKEIMQVIKETSKPFNGQNQSEWSPEYGYGKIQAYEGLKKVLALPSAIATIRNTSTPVTLLKQDNEWKILFNSGENFANINVCGINGTIVKQKNLKNIHRGQEEILSFNDLEKGFYIVSIKTKNHLTSQKIIVK